MKKILFLLMTMISFGFQSVRSQDAPLKIVTGHPDFKIQVKRCVASDKTVIIDLILKNEGTDDVENVILWACTTMETIITYDNEGNIYGCGANFVKLANNPEYSNHDSGVFCMLSGIPMQMSLKIEGVSPSAERIARITLPFNCQAWGLNSQKPVKITNIPITRD